MVVYWITNKLGIKDASEDLTEENYGSIIIDLRHISYITNTEGTIVDNRDISLCIVKMFKMLASREKTILQSKGLSTAGIFAAAALAYGTNMKFGDAMDFIKRKVPDIVIDETLAECVKVLVCEG